MLASSQISDPHRPRNGPGAGSEQLKIGIYKCQSRIRTVNADSERVKQCPRYGVELIVADLPPCGGHLCKCDAFSSLWGSLSSTSALWCPAHPPFRLHRPPSTSGPPVSSSEIRTLERSPNSHAPMHAPAHPCRPMRTHASPANRSASRCIAQPTSLGADSRCQVLQLPARLRRLTTLGDWPESERRPSAQVERLVLSLRAHERHLSATLTGVPVTVVGSAPCGIER